MVTVTRYLCITLFCSFHMLIVINSCAIRLEKSVTFGDMFICSFVPYRIAMPFLYSLFCSFQLLATGCLHSSARDEEPLINRRVNWRRCLVLTLGDVERAGFGALWGVLDSGVGPNPSLLVDEYKLRDTTTGTLLTERCLPSGSCR